MTKEKLEKFRQRIEGLRKSGGVKSSEVEAVAKALGRIRSQRGKEPTWISQVFSDLRPVSIPCHSSDLNRFTKNNILDQLEIDLDRYQEIL